MEATKISQLKSEIKAVADEGRACRQKINASKGLERDHWWNEKRAVGDGARGLLIAYGLLRGMPYERMERHCREEPSGRAIHALCVKYGGEEWTPDRVKELLRRSGAERAAA